MQADISKANQIDKVPISLAPNRVRDNNTLRAYREIKRRIMDSEMQAGNQYLEQELAEMLGMSRTPVREALIRLADEKLIEVRPRHGARVLTISTDEIADIYEILAELESIAIRRVAASGLPDAELKQLDHACLDMIAATKIGDMATWATLDQEFHVRLVAAAGNARMAEMVRSLMDQVHRARRQSLANHQAPHASNIEHAGLLDAIRRRDPDDAVRIQSAQRERVKTHLVEQLRTAKISG